MSARIKKQELRADLHRMLEMLTRVKSGNATSVEGEGIDPHFAVGYVEHGIAILIAKLGDPQALESLRKRYGKPDSQHTHKGTP